MSAPVELSGGERVLIRRALVLYAQQWMAEKVKHRKAGDSYNADYDQARIDACDRVADKLRLSGQPSAVSAAPAEQDPYVEVQRLRKALRKVGSLIEQNQSPSDLREIIYNLLTKGL